MEKITCNVIKDLLPLYIDNVLSEDSSKLVKDHINTCESCRAYYDEMSDDSIPMATKNAETDKAALKYIKRKLATKRVCTILVTSLTVFLLAIGVYYLLFCKQRYMSYEETGLYVKENHLYAKDSYYCFYSYQDDSNKNLYIYLSTTYNQSHNKSGKDTYKEIFDTESEIIPTPENESDIENEPDFNNESVTNITQNVNKIYYVPEQYVKSLKNFERNKLDAAKDEFTLVWEAE